jgi:hypothetical protein
LFSLYKLHFDLKVERTERCPGVSKARGTIEKRSPALQSGQLLIFSKWSAHLNQPILKSCLLREEAQLVELLQSVNFGRVEALRVRGGVPILEPSPRIVQTLKMGGGQNGPREEASLPDYWLKQPIVELLQTIRHIGDGEILAIDVRYGLPFTVEIERSPASPNNEP